MNKYMSPPSNLSSPLNDLTRIILWLQIFFSLAIACVSSVVNADDGSFFISNQKLMEQPNTQVYFPNEGEKINSATKKYNFLLDSFHKVNQFRTFIQDSNNLQLDDKLDTSLIPLSEIFWDDIPISSTSDKNNNIQARKIEKYIPQISGGFFNRKHNGDETNSDHCNGVSASVTHYPTIGNIVSNEIQNLSNYHGAARVQLGSDKNFSFENSQIDLLLPLHEEKNILSFMQGVIYRANNRIQSNLGVGYRWFINDWMLGTSTFLDYDLSHNHTRLGFGSEYWRNFLKLGINTYFHLTGWKNSHNLDGYKEQPANGWDIRAQYWLPSLPKLSGKFVYERYYGDENITLFNQNNYYLHPNRTSISVNYTPIPLLTFSAEKRYQKQLDRDDIKFRMNINYQFGKPWKYQIDPNIINEKVRNLSKNRYDLVDRDNNIVLNFYEKEIVRLDTTDLIVGYSKEYKPLNLSINSRYGLERIDWSAPQQFISSGGKILQNGEDWIVVMPVYRPGSKAINSYIISGIAVDKKGNISSQADTQITVIQQAKTNTRTNSFTSLANKTSLAYELTHNKEESSQKKASIKVNNQEEGKSTTSSIKNSSENEMNTFQRIMQFFKLKEITNNY